MIRRESLHMITTFPSTSSGGGRKEIGREEEISAQSASRILELVESPRRHKSAFCRRKPDCKSLRMVHCSPLFLLLLLASTLTIHPTGCLCHAGPWGSSFQTTNASPTRSGIIRRFISSSCSNHEAQNGGVNPFVLGFQRALTQSSLPLAISTVPASSCSVADRHKNKNHGDKESPTPNASSSFSFARFASVQPKESSEIRATIQPLMMQLKRRKLTKRFTSNNRHSREDVSEEEAFWLDQDDVDDYFDEETSMMTPLDAQKSMIPCSTKTHSAALHGKFIHEASNHQRRFIPFRSVTAASKAAVEEQSISDSSMINPTETRGGSSSTAIATNAAAVAAHRPLYFWENMLSGAVSRSVAQTIMHPANCMKTMLQNSNDMAFRDLCQPEMFRRLTVGAGANFVLSIPHGAVNFAVLEFVRGRLSTAVENIPYLDERKDAFGPALDFLSSCLSTITCSIVSTPQMMITDNIMAGTYPNLMAATSGLYQNRGIMGFYAGWWPGLVGKIPSYALTWTFFQQLKRMRNSISDRPARNYENTIMGCLASAATVTIMIPMDTIKTRLVVQSSAKVLSSTSYKGIVDCAIRITREEGVKTFYRGLAPRLISVVPMIGIQFGVYEAMKRIMLQRDEANAISTKSAKTKKTALPPLTDRYGAEEALEEAAMEVAADGSTTSPAPHFLKKLPEKPKRGVKTFFGSFSFK